MSFTKTDAQERAADLIVGPATHILLRGGSRSGKTFEICRTNLFRAAICPESSHTILRQKFNHLKASIVLDTMPKVLRLCFPDLPQGDRMLNKTDWFLEFPNKSRVWYGGLDDKERTEKILGQEHSTITLNECSQITYASRNKAVTRLAQNVGLRPKALYDCNPPRMGHWIYRLFMKKIEPESGAALSNPDNYATMQMNPLDNPYLAPEYLTELDNLPAKDRKRFRDGEFQPQVEGALWTQEMLDKNRVAKSQLPHMKRITVNIDPSGCSGPEDTRSDEVGLTVTGKGSDNKGYLLADHTGHMSPEQWGRAAVTLFDDWEADVIIGEKNYGGDMVRAVVQACRHNVPFKLVTASRGKHVRAEPVSSLYQQGKIKHMGIFVDLEDQLCEFSNAGYGGEISPDRADSAIWGFTELFIGSKTYGMLDV